MKPKIKFDDHIFTITWWSDNENQQEEFYNIIALEKITSEKGPLNLKSINYSEIILDHLLKRWITKEFLYELGQLTVKIYPENQINWLETFKMVERHFYHKALDKHEKLKNPNLSLVDSLFARIERGVEERDKREIENAIEHLAREMMTKYNIPI